MRRGVSAQISTSPRARPYALSRSKLALHANQFWMDVSSGSAASCLELGLRLFTGCGATQNNVAALDCWRRISDPTHPNFISSASRSLKAKALSCLTNAYFEKAILPNRVLRIDDLYRAAHLADDSASLGFVSPIVLAIGTRIEGIGLRRQATCPFKGVDTSRFAALEFLLKVTDARTKELDNKFQKRDAKVSQAPNLYICASEGCGIEGTSRSGLLKCSGKCSLSVKASYCSKECQKADWKRHTVCKGEATAHSNAATPPTPKKTDDSITGDGDVRSDGRELIIELPGLSGGMVQLSSTNMTASGLKEFRDQVIQEAARRS